MTSVTCSLLLLACLPFFWMTRILMELGFLNARFRRASVYPAICCQSTGISGNCSQLFTSRSFYEAAWVASKMMKLVISHCIDLFCPFRRATIRLWCCRSSYLRLFKSALTEISNPLPEVKSKIRFSKMIDCWSSYPDQENEQATNTREKGMQIFLGLNRVLISPS